MIFRDHGADYIGVPGMNVPMRNKIKFYAVIQSILIVENRQISLPVAN